ncbi:1070_t:CDS:2 [Cetraspora pellucida]|uniref:1070_t:CDS:1 n=1 Tax=Cetraspora pellucida TaxID=1433469 RepID=A0A9N9ETL6_9GLOM|nr:1070_t:CDS:2 [Cetraspora pellucida]
MHKDQIRVDDETLSYNIVSNYSPTLLIGEIIDLKTENNSESSVVETAQAVLPEDLDYNPSDVLNNFLEGEKQAE